MAYKVLAATVLALLPQEKNEAEELFKKMEEKILQAKTIQVKVKALKDGKSEFAVDVLLGEANRARLDVETKDQGSTYSFGSVSDGKSMRFTGKGLRDGPDPTPEKFGVLIRKTLAIFGGLSTFNAFDTQERRRDPSTFYEVSDFVLGPKGKVGEIEAQMVQYKVTTEYKTGITVIMVWIDSKTHLPLKRTVTTATKKSEETYSNFKLDEKIDPAKFELPKENK